MLSSWIVDLWWLEYGIAHWQCLENHVKEKSLLRFHLPPLCGDFAMCLPAMKWQHGLRIVYNFGTVSCWCPWFSDAGIKSEPWMVRYCKNNQWPFCNFTYNKRMDDIAVFEGVLWVLKSYSEIWKELPLLTIDRSKERKISPSSWHIASM